MCLQRKMYATGMRPRVGNTATASKKWPEHDKIWAKRRSVWGRVLELALQVGPQLRKLTIGNPPPHPPRDG